MGVAQFCSSFGVALVVIFPPQVDCTCRGNYYQTGLQEDGPQHCSPHGLVRGSCPPLSPGVAFKTKETSFLFAAIRTPALL